MTTFIGKKRERAAAEDHGLPTVAGIRENLASSDEWCLRGLIAIFNGQTEDEKATATTKEDNGIGFTGVDAELLTSFAIQYIDRGRLTGKQMIYLRKKITKYAAQLWWVAYLKATAAAANETVADGVADEKIECEVCGGVARPAGTATICVDCGCESNH